MQARVWGYKCTDFNASLFLRLFVIKAAVTMMITTKTAAQTTAMMTNSVMSENIERNNCRKARDGELID